MTLQDPEEREKGSPPPPLLPWLKVWGTGSEGKRVSAREQSGRVGRWRRENVVAQVGPRMLGGVVNPVGEVLVVAFDDAGKMGRMRGCDKMALGKRATSVKKSMLFTAF